MQEAGHVEKTNDRDYEVEERSVHPNLLAIMSNEPSDDSRLWRRQPYDYKKSQKDILTR